LILKLLLPAADLVGVNPIALASFGPVACPGNACRAIFAFSASICGVVFCLIVRSV